MKNILAENLLRFGVKNLSEFEKQSLQESDFVPGQTQPTTTDPRVAIIQQWGGKLVTKTGKFTANPATDIEKPSLDRLLPLDGKGFVEFELMFNPPLVSVSKENVAFAKYKYNFKNDTWLASSGDIKSGNIQPYKWTSRHPGQGDLGDWSQYDYDVRDVMKNMEIAVNNSFIKTLKFNLGQPTPSKPETKN
jgi:hypothetical protein